jgi:hypothetical protein
MAWQEDMTTLLRYVINDYESPYENSTDNLQRLIVTAAQLTKNDVDFSVEYSISISTTGITPDPTSNSDNAFVNLVVLKAACLLARGEQRRKALNAITIKDGPANIDGRGTADATRNWADTVCKDYTEAELEYRLGNSKAGEAIIGPYRFDGSNHQGFGSNREYYRGGDGGNIFH